MGMMANWTMIRFAQLLAALTLGLGANNALAQSATPKAATSKAKAKSTSAKSSAKPDAAAAAVGGAQPTLIGQYGTWGAYTAAPNGRKVCFALAKASSAKTSPPNRPRDPSYAFVSTRPAEKVKDEVSVMIGYQFKPGFEATLDVGGSKFALYTQGDGAWIKNAADESRLVEGLRKGGEAVVRGQSAKGTESTDTYALKGLAQALDRVAQECR